MNRLRARPFLARRPGIRVPGFEIASLRPRAAADQIRLVCVNGRPVGPQFRPVDLRYTGRRTVSGIPSSRKRPPGSTPESDRSPRPGLATINLCEKNRPLPLVFLPLFVKAFPDVSAPLRSRPGRSVRTLRSALSSIFSFYPSDVNAWNSKDHNYNWGEPAAPSFPPSLRRDCYGLVRRQEIARQSPRLLLARSARCARSPACGQDPRPCRFLSECSSTRGRLRQLDGPPLIVVRWISTS